MAMSIDCVESLCAALLEIDSEISIGANQLNFGGAERMKDSYEGRLSGR